MSDINVEHPDEPRRGKMVRFLCWLRDNESAAAREHFARAGIWSSRIYAVVLPIVVLLAAWADPPPGVAFGLAMVWGLLSRIYLWYQARAILAYPVIVEKNASSDQINSFMPAIAISFLLLLWAVLGVLYLSQIAPKMIDYGVFGWFAIAVALVDTMYDLTINNRMILMLSKVPAREEFGIPAKTH